MFPIIFPENRAEFGKFSKIEKEKYIYYIPILSSRLNKIHKLDMPNLFWEQVLGPLDISISQSGSSNDALASFTVSNPHDGSDKDWAAGHW